MKSKAKPAMREDRSRGEKAAAEIRARCNKLTRGERERLLNQAMRIAYGKNWRAIAKQNNEKLFAESNRFTKEERRRAQEEFEKWWFGSSSKTRTTRRHRRKH